MGMHHGIVCAELPWSELIARMRRFAGEMIEQGIVANPDSYDPSPREGNGLLAGERDGKAYLFDTSLLLSGAEPGLIVAVAAADPPALVVGCGAETVSGTYYLAAARGQDLIRCYFQCHSDMSQPFERGNPLLTERNQPLDGDSDGVGLRAALKSLGFDFDAWFEQGPWHAILYTGEGADAGVTKGALDQALSEHHSRLKLAPEEQPTIKVVTRDRTGTVVDVSDTGVRLGQIEPRRGSRARRLFKKLTGR